VPSISRLLVRAVASTVEAETADKGAQQVQGRWDAGHLQVFIWLMGLGQVAGAGVRLSGLGMGRIRAQGA
jgi:hypothetical protein